MRTEAQLRRATIEDLPGLIELWRTENLPCDSLEKRFKEFQVAVSPEGELLGTLGLQLSGTEGLLHSEAFAHADQADELREQLFERLKVLAANHGLVRLWTQFAAPYWRHGVFMGASDLSKLPPAFGGSPGSWLVLQLKEEISPLVSIEKEFALFREAEKEETERLFRRARVLKVVAFVLGFVVFAMVVLWAVLFMRAQRLRPRAADQPAAVCATESARAENSAA